MSEKMINSRWWIPLASLVAGPVLTFGYWAADVFLLNPGLYPSTFQGDALATLWRLASMTDVAAISAGRHYSMLLKRDGSVLASGQNMFNNLGFDGASTSKPTRILFRRRTPSEIEAWKKEWDEFLRSFDPEKDLPILTKPPRAVQTSNPNQVP